MHQGKPISAELPPPSSNTLDPSKSPMDALRAYLREIDARTPPRVVSTRRLMRLVRAVRDTTKAVVRIGGYQWLVEGRRCPGCNGLLVAPKSAMAERRPVPAEITICAPCIERMLTVAAMDKGCRIPPPASATMPGHEQRMAGHIARIAPHIDKESPCPK